MSAPAQSISNLPFHPLFSEPDADTVLCSIEGTLFGVHSYTLRNTSGLFHTIFSLPQAQGETKSTEALPVFERDDTLIPLLKMMYGLSSPVWEGFDQIEPVLELAERWDTPGPIATIRSSITAPVFLNEPLRLYALATHFEWEEVAQLAATASLSYCIFDPIYEPLLSVLPSKYLDPLLHLHGQRRHQFKIAIDSPARFTAGNVDPFYCGSCSVPIDNSTWRALKARVITAVDMKPSGESLYDGEEMDTWEEAKMCWKARCKTKCCGCLNYDKAATLRQIRGSIDLLPSTVYLDRD